METEEKEMENQDYENMNEQELWAEIIAIVNATHFAECDRTLFLKCIKEWKKRKIKERD